MNHSDTSNVKPESGHATLADDIASNTSMTSSPDDMHPSGFIRRLLRGIPTLIVLGMLAGVAWFGYRYDWQIPSMSQLLDNDTKQGDQWCDEHSVPEEICIACNPELMPKGQLYGWCKDHGVHECVLDHPDLAQIEHPQLTREDLDRAEHALAVRPRPQNDPLCKMHLRRIQFPSIEAVNRAGIDIGLVERARVTESIRVSGELVYDPTRVAHVSSRAPGTLTRVLAEVGTNVTKGDLLALVDATEVGKAKSELLDSLVRLDLARKTLERLRGLGSSTIPAKEIERASSELSVAQVAVNNAMQRIANLGLPIEQLDLERLAIEDVERQLVTLGIPEAFRPDSGASSNHLPIVAPKDGLVVMRDAVAGELVDTGIPIFTVVDTSRMWLLLNVPLEEAELVKIGQTVFFRPDGSSVDHSGPIDWISTDVDAETRTLQVRANLDNPQGRLRNETYGSGRIILREEPAAIVVPADAIHWEGCCYIAFVRDRDYFKEGSYKVFHARSVRTGVTQNGVTEVIAGLLPGEVVATEGGGLLRAELLKGNLGAG